MSYHHYTTEGIILRREDRGENDAVYVVLTETLGLVIVQATGIRLLKSKLRTVLQQRNIVKITLVRGKTLWRVTTCVFIATAPNVLAPAIPRLYKLLRQFVVFDESIPLIYQHFKNFFTIPEDVSSNSRRLKVAETITTARVLATLGMLDQIELPEVENVSIFTALFCDQNEATHEVLLKHIQNRLGETLL